MNRIILLALLLGLIPLAGAGGAPQPPLAVAIVATPTEALISWIPPAQSDPEETTFNVYALDPTGIVPLGTVAFPETAFLATSGYSVYGVATVIGGEESVPHWQCVTVRYQPPPPQVGIGCLHPAPTSGIVKVTL